jgi:hypothetical protein
MARKQSLDIEESKIKLVIQKLEDAEKPITKKEACSILGITYNTTRLANIVEEYKQKKETEKKLKSIIRKTAPSEAELKEIIEGYLNGEPYSEISSSTHRSVGQIKRILESFNLPERQSGADYFNNILFLDSASIADNYSPGDLVFSARYNSLAEIVKEVGIHADHGTCYRIFCFGKEQQYAHQPYYELLDLRELNARFNLKPLTEQGVQPRNLPTTR